MAQDQVIARYRIARGPSREQLFDSLRLCREGRELSFGIETTSEEWNLKVLIQKIGVEDGSGDNWLVWGLVVSPVRGMCYRTFEAYFNTEKRSGWIKILAD